jgi:hypothetical protein
MILTASPLHRLIERRKVQLARSGFFGEWSRSMSYLIVRTDVRQVSEEAVDAANYARDERNAPERRRQTAMAESRDAALHMARAFASSGPVRSGRQRVKVIRLY